MVEKTHTDQYCRIKKTIIKLVEGLEELQKACLLETARIFRKVPDYND